MKKIFLLAVATASVFIYSCKSKSDKTSANGADTAKTEAAAQPASPTTATPPAEQPTNAPKTYKVTFTPDTAILGKQQEALLKVIPVNAVDLSDPDGKSKGIELTFKISLTNKNKIGGNGIGFSSNNFRLLLDNNTSISEDAGAYLSADAEATKETDVITYKIPAGAKPKALTLFYSDTRATVGVSLQ